MQPDTMRTLAEYIHELRQREHNRNHNGTDSQPAFDTTIEDDAHWNPGDQDGDAGRSTNNRG
jgi:hypothetical protein